MRVLCVLLAVVSLSAGAQVALEAELGWEGHATAGEINPLWLRITNESPATVVGELVVRQHVVSPWRGAGQREMTKPLALGPGGHTRLVLPWPLALGAEELVVSYYADGAQLSSVEVKVELAPRPVRLYVGRPAAGVQPGTVVYAPEDLPRDPLVYSSVSAIEVAQGDTLSPSLQQALHTWRILLSESQENSFAHPSSEELRNALRRAEFEGEAWWWYVLATILYLVAAGVLLGRWAQGRRWGFVGLSLVCLGLSLYGAVSPTVPLNTIQYQWSVSRDDGVEVDMVWSGLFSRRGQKITLDGLWADEQVVDEPGAGRDVHWEWGPEGWRTHVRFGQGDTLVLWTLDERAPTEGWKEVPPKQAAQDPIWEKITADVDVLGELAFREQSSVRNGKKEVNHVLLWPTDS